MMSGEEQFLADIELTQQGSHARGMEELSENDPPEIDEFEIPEGEQYSLVSKRLKAVRIQQIAEALDLPTRSSTAEARQAIKEKLTDMEYEPENVQVIIQGRGDDAMMFLVNNTGIIKTIECGKAACEQRGRSDARSALWGARHVEHNIESESRFSEIEQLRLDLQSALARTEQEQAMTAQKEEQILALQGALDKEKQKSKRFWREKCEQLLTYEENLEAKEVEIALLKARLMTATSNRSEYADRVILSPHRVEGNASRTIMTATSLDSSTVQISTTRRGKAPPIEPFTGEGVDILFEEWLPSFERTATWNGWSEAEKLIQLAGHLRGKALQEWSLLGGADRAVYKNVTTALKERLDPSRKALAVQDFHHLSQKHQESVADFILCLEQTFRRAYGYDKVGEETRHTLLHVQLQEGLKYTIMEAPAVSGSQTYAELCMAAKNEERRQSELAKRQHYARTSLQSGSTSSHGTQVEGVPRDQTIKARAPRPPVRVPLQKICYICNSPDHLANKCDAKKMESQGKSKNTQRGQSAAKRIVGTSEERSQSGVDYDLNQSRNQDPINFLYSSDSDGDVWTVRVSDTGSKPQCARVTIQGVPVIGIIDTAADITIMGGVLFQKVASVARLKKRNFKLPDITPHGYDQRPFKLDGRMELEVEFGDKTMKTVVYIKMDGRDQLLLSEGVCRQLGLVMYHPDVQVWRGGKDKKPLTESKDVAIVPMVRAKLVNSVRVLPQQCSLVSVKLEGNFDAAKQLLLEPEDLGCDLWMEQTLLSPFESNNGKYQVVIENCTELGWGNDLRDCH